MPKNYSKLRVAYFAVSCGTLLVIGGWASTRTLVPASKASQRVSSSAQVKRVSKTDALEVVGARVTKDFVKISLKNVSSKNVNGIQLSVNGGTLQIEFLDADEPDHQKLQPGAIYEESFPIKDSSEAVDVAILAVTFDDKTSAGKPSLANEIFETRLGVRKQLMRFSLLVADALNSPDADSIAILDKLKSQVNDLPNEDSADSGPMRMGQHQVKQQIIQEIDYVKRRHVNQGAVMTIRKDLSDIKNRHDRKIQDLQ